MLGLGNSNVRHKKVFADLNDVSGLQLWLKNGAGVAVGQWDDSSRQGRHATQATSGNQAAVSGGGLDFEEGEADHYDFTAIDIAKSQGFCVAWVMDLESSSNNTILSDGNNEAIQVQNNNKLRIYCDNDANKTTSLHNAGGFGVAKMLLILNRTGAGAWSVYKNGATSGLSISDDSSGSALSDEGDNIMGLTFDTLGVRNAVAGTYFDGKLYELAIWDRDLTTREIIDVGAYLKDVHSL